MPTIQLNESTVLDIPMPEPANIESFFLFGLHKSGSTLLDQIFTKVCLLKNLPYINIPGLTFQQGIPDQLWESQNLLNSLIKDGYCYGVFRYYPNFLKSNKLLEKRRKILLVRDPRDAIVSAYYSFAFSHPIPLQGKVREQMIQERIFYQRMNIETFALDRAIQVKHYFNMYHQNLNQDSLLKVYRYEDVIFKKYEWIKDMLDFLQLSLDVEQIAKIAEENNYFPKSENPNNHIRKVVPGDHKEKLSSDCIQQINEILSEVLDHYNY
ncbi:MAG: sulfotransferase domain-containing protein [Okeania sp. SIO3I5]|uniref:sulfotransferase domain-containing protein n=1 Tax=Okeania sp. SIO3I5 TaxID=2607805 RepID=UPI0013BC45E8|nr:sulfotransferase domain-containing protein [Okeania sp. SIO3I5]NEQ37164.1 sulfotransferase domain-containing protein [Okeania sp. SIO3I5]